MSRKPKKLAGIDQRGESAWRIRYVKDGKRHSETVVGSQADAVARRDVIRADIARNTWTAPTNMTLRNGQQHGLSNISSVLSPCARTSGNRASSIATSYRRSVQVSLQKLSTVRVNEFYRELEASGLSPATVRYAHIVLGSCLKAAVKIGALARSPVANASPPKGKAESGGRALTQAELDKLLNGFKGDALFVLVALAAGTGARVNELLALEWSAVDWPTKALRIDAALKPTKAGLERGMPKTERSRSTIRLDDGLAALLLAERDRQETEQRMIQGIGAA